MAEGQTLIDTSDMYAVHNALRRALADAPAQIKVLEDGDKGRAKQLAEYLAEVLWLLHAHHLGEDLLLYPLLAQRAPENADLFARMEAQHAAVTASLETASQAVERFATSGSFADGQAVGDAFTSLLAVTEAHLTDEEEKVLSIAARVISAPEWGALSAHALTNYQGDRIWLPFGLVLEAMPQERREDMLAHLPAPVLGMWTGTGADAFAREMASIRGE